MQVLTGKQKPNNRNSFFGKMFFNELFEMKFSHSLLENPDLNEIIVRKLFN